MAVWMDNQLKYPFRGRTILSCHLMADTTAELVEMASRLGLKPRWIQKAGTPREHFDLMGKRKFELAQQHGVQVVDRREFVNRLRRKRGEKEL